MQNKAQPKSLIARKMGNAGYRKRHENGYEAFKLEAQILLALENKGWSYTDLAQATNTHKSNVSRDLSAGGILSATLSCISRIAEALGMRLVTLLIPRDKIGIVLPRIEELVRESFDTAAGEVKMINPPALQLMPQLADSNTQATVNIDCNYGTYNMEAQNESYSNAR